MSNDHQIFPHGDLRQLAAGLWQVTGSLKLPLPRNMTAYRLPSGGLLLHSVVALDDARMEALESLGRPEVMVVPHPYHIMDTAFFKERYPDLRVFADAHAKRRMEKQFDGRAPVDGTIAEGLDDLGVRHRAVPGMKYDEVTLDLELEEGGRALVFTDIFTAFEPKTIADRLTAAPRGGVGLARMVRWRQVNDRSAVRGYFNELAELDDIRWLLTSHGDALSQDCAETLRRSARFA
jgi:hypothetical protein